MVNQCKGCGQDGVQEPYFYCYNCNVARKAAKLTQPVTPKPAYSAPAQEERSKVRSMAVSYCKDMVCSGNVPVQLLFFMSKKIEQYILTGDSQEYIPETPIEEIM